MDTKRETINPGTYLRVQCRRRVRIKKHLSGTMLTAWVMKVICIPNPSDTQLTHITNLLM